MSGAFTPAMRRTLETIAAGKAAQLAERDGMKLAVLGGMALERGLVRVVKHRDHTQTYALTQDGRAALARARGGR